MGIIRLGFEYLRQKYLTIFPTQTVDTGDENFQNLNFMASVADEAQQNQLKIEGYNNPYSQTGDVLVKTLNKFGWYPLSGYSARVRIAVTDNGDNFVGEPFSINAYDQDFTATCTSQTDGGEILILDIQTDAPAEFVFLQDLTVTYTGNISVGEISNINLLFGGRLPEGDIAFRTRMLSEAITPNQFRLVQSYENTYLEPMPALIPGQNGKFSLVYPKSSNITDDKLLFLYIGFNSRVPVKSDATDTYVEYPLELNNGVIVTFGVNIYGTVLLQLLVYVQPGTGQEELDKVIALLNAYSFTPTSTAPIYGKDIVNSIAATGINSVLAISFVYDGLTQIALTSAGYNDYILQDDNPIIIIEGNQ